MAKYLGKGQIGICQRSGQKMKRADMVEDGQVRGLLVHPDWWEPYHPQLVPPPMRADGIAKQRPAPDQVPQPNAPVLSGSLVINQPNLTWTPSSSKVSNVSSYSIYRNVNGGLYSLLAIVQVTFGTDFMLDGEFWEETATYAQPYIDTTVIDGNSYNYYVVGSAQEGGNSPNSNIVVFLGASFRITQDGNMRITAEGNSRIIQ